MLGSEPLTIFLTGGSNEATRFLFASDDSTPLSGSLSDVTPAFGAGEKLSADLMVSLFLATVPPLSGLLLLITSLNTAKATRPIRIAAAAYFKSGDCLLNIGLTTASVFAFIASLILAHALAGGVTSMLYRAGGNLCPSSASSMAIEIFSQQWFGGFTS